MQMTANTSLWRHMVRQLWRPTFTGCNTYPTNWRMLNPAFSPVISQAITAYNIPADLLLSFMSACALRSSHGCWDLSPRFWDLSPTKVPNCFTSTQLNTILGISEFLNVISYARVLRSFSENLEPRISPRCGLKLVTYSKKPPTSTPISSSLSLSEFTKVRQEVL